MDGTIRRTQDESKDAEAFAHSLRQRGLCLARVSGPDRDANEKARAGYQRYVKDHPDDARKFGIAPPQELSEGQLVLVALDENNAPAVYLFNQALVVRERRRLKQYLATLKRPDLPDIPGAARQLEANPAQPVTAIEQSYFGPGDLARRWRYTKQGVQKLARREDFPPPRFAVNRGRIRIWAAPDIEAYERERPELHSEAAKRRKVRGFLIARKRGTQARA